MPIPAQLVGAHARIAGPVVALLVLCMACGGQAAPVPSPSPIPTPSTLTLTVTLTDSGCGYDGPREVPAGRLLAHLVNQTSNSFFLGLGRIDNGHTFQDFVAWTDAERAREQSGQRSVGAPDWLKDFGNATANPGASKSFASAVGQGVFAFACGRLDFTVSPAKELGIWVAGPFDVK